MILSGFELKVVVDDSAVESSPQTLEHNRLFQEGSGLINPYMLLVGRESKSVDSESARQDLERGIELLNQAVSINPANWSAHWIVGKAQQALGNSELACDAFGKAYAIHKGNVDVAREYMFECLNLGRADKGIAAARHAVVVAPDNAGLVANLALALLISAKLDEAATTVARALAMAPDDAINQNLSRVIADVQSGRRPQPLKLTEINGR